MANSTRLIGGHHRVQIYNVQRGGGTPTFERTLGVTGMIKTDDTGFHLPNGMAVSNGKLYVVDDANHRVQIYNLPITSNDRADLTIGITGTTKTDNSGFNRPAGLAVTNDKLYVTDRNNHRIQIYNLPITSNDMADLTIGTTGTTKTDNSGFNQPRWSLTVANGKLYVCGLRGITAYKFMIYR